MHRGLSKYLGESFVPIRLYALGASTSTWVSHGFDFVSFGNSSEFPANLRGLGLLILPQIKPFILTKDK